jgi:hypothetical protein
VSGLRPKSCLAGQGGERTSDDGRWGKAGGPQAREGGVGYVRAMASQPSYLIYLQRISSTGFSFFANPHSKKLRFWSPGRWVGGSPGFPWWPPVGGWVGTGGFLSFLLCGLAKKPNPEPTSQPVSASHCIR